VNGLTVRRGADGSLVVGQIPPLLDSVLRELPALLGPEQPEAAKRRLFPDPGGDPEAVAEWRRTQHPELFALLADARSVVERDLASLTPGPDGSRLTIPAAHANAWISALNAARLALGAVHEVTAADMESEAEPSLDERGWAILRIHLYAWLQETLIGAAPPE
jgi:uncharacterized protein DUF2017